MERSNAFCMRDLVMVVLLVVLVAVVGLSFLVPDLGHGQLRRRSVCMANTKTIGTAILMYGEDNNDAFPLAPGCTDPRGTFMTSDKPAWDPAMSGASHWGTAAQQNLFLLVEASLIDEKSFICPQTDDTVTERPAGQSYGFGGPNNISYGLQYIGPEPTETVTGSASSPRRKLRDEVAILADEGYADHLDRRSGHHKGGGESVLFVSTRVIFSQEDNNAVGYKDNNIYTMDMTADHDVTTPGSGWVDAVSEFDSIICWAPD